MERYRVQRRRTRRLEARALSSRAWVVVMLVDRTDRIFSNEAVDESSFYGRAGPGQYTSDAMGTEGTLGAKTGTQLTFHGHSETIFAGAPECRGAWEVSSLLRVVLAQRRQALRKPVE